MHRSRRPFSKEQKIIRFARIVGIYLLTIHSDWLISKCNIITITHLLQFEGVEIIGRAVKLITLLDIYIVILNNIKITFNT